MLPTVGSANLVKKKNRWNRHHGDRLMISMRPSLVVVLQQRVAARSAVRHLALTGAAGKRWAADADGSCRASRAYATLFAAAAVVFLVVRILDNFLVVQHAGLAYVPELLYSCTDVPLASHDFLVIAELNNKCPEQVPGLLPKRSTPLYC